VDRLELIFFGELYVVVALIADQVVVVIGVQDLHVDLKLGSHKITLNSGLCKLASDSISNESLTFNTNLFLSRKCSVLFDVKNSVMTLRKHACRSWLVCSLQIPATCKPLELNVLHVLDVGTGPC